jgi:hypothetical protein
MGTMMGRLVMFAAVAAVVGCVAPTGMAHLVPSAPGPRASLGGGTGTSGPFGSGTLAWSSAGLAERSGMSAMATWIASRPASEVEQGVAPCFAVHLPAGPIDITVPMFLAEVPAANTIYSDVMVYGIAGLLLSHQRGAHALFAGVISSFVGDNDRFQLSAGDRIESSSGLSLAAELVVVDEGRPWRADSASPIEYERHRSVLVQFEGSFGRARPRSHP